MATHFYKGDKLKAVNVLDDDGEPCEGRLIMGEIVTMDDRSSEYRPFIIVTRENGRQLHIEKTRFELHSRVGSEGVVIVVDELSEDTSHLVAPKPMWDLLMSPVNPPQEVLDYMTGKISLEESMHITNQRAMKGPDWNALELNLCPEVPLPNVPDCMVGKTLQESLHILDQLSMKGPDWNTEIDGEGLLLFQMGKLSLDDYLKIRNRKENGLTDEECVTMINNGENK